MSAVLAAASPRRIKATHRRRRKVTAGHFVQRYYDPASGGFLSVDPMAVDMNTAANFCRYCYAANNPYKFTDPDGRQTAKTHAGDTAEQRAAAMAERKRRESEGRIGGAGANISVISQIVDAVISTLAPVSSNANKRPNNPTKVPDGAASRLSATNSSALLTATGGQVVLPAGYVTVEGGALAYETTGVLAQRVITSPGGQRVIAASCIAIGVCGGQKPPGQFVRDIEQRARTYEGMMSEMQRRWSPYLTPMD